MRAVHNLLTICLALIPSAWSFSPIIRRKNAWKLPAIASAVAEQTITSSPPSWDDLAAILEASSVKQQQEPVVTLYRDTNGWCPFCERVWVALRAKNIPYQETLVSLQNKPEWYKQLVPTTLVPAVLFYEEDEEKKERKIVWESSDILKSLDKAFPDTPKLMLDTPEFQEAQEMNDALSAAGFAYVYAGRNETLTPQDVEDRKAAFEEQLNKLDAALAESGPFRLGKDFTGMDAIMIPTLERWRWQLPITVEFDMSEGRPYLQAWFDAMDSYAPFANRVAGDQYSWTATASMFLRYFGGGEDKPEVAAAIERADKAAADLSKSFAQQTVSDDPFFGLEAAAKLVSNYEAVVKDCTSKEPISQKNVPRASNVEVADAVLRYVASILLLSSDDSLEMARTAPLVKVSDVSEGALVARTVACRLCVPRDMSAPAAAVLRGVLAVVADRLED